MRALFSFPNELVRNGPVPPLRADRQAFQPAHMLQGGTVTSTFRRHLERSPPSKAPGLDIDTDIQYTEGPPYLEKLEVRSPVSGKVTFRGGEYGTVRIRDSAGFEHSLIHMHLDVGGKIKGPAGYMAVSLGDYVERGQIIGLLGNVRVPSKRDHVHYYLRGPDGRLIDPANVWRDDAGTVREIRDHDRHFEDLMLQERMQRPNRPYYDNLSPTRVDNVA